MHNNLLSQEQHGQREALLSEHWFTRGISITSAIIDLVEGKVIDCMGYDLILTKLKRLGDKSTALTRFKSYSPGSNPNR